MECRSNLVLLMPIEVNMCKTKRRSVDSSNSLDYDAHFSNNKTAL